VKNALLTVLTLGIYAPWAKTARRQHIWGNAEFQGDRFGYTGTGAELLVGYLKALGAMVAFGVAVGLITLPVDPRYRAMASLVLYTLGTWLAVGFAAYWSRRYLLSRTVLRGIHFSLAGRASDYAKATLIGGLLTALTLGIYGPFALNRVRGLLIRNSRWGDQPFHYDGVGKEVFVIVVKGLFLSTITLGIYFPWYVAALERYFVAHTTFQGARGQSTVTGGLLFEIFLFGFVAALFTSGLAFPWVYSYALSTSFERTSWVGTLDLERVGHQPATGDPAGDALASVLGADLAV
jgi:uncharacterized membrane protein YjgN (DUF898 family)